MGFFTQEPYGYLAGVGCLSAIMGLVSFCAAAAETLVDGKFGFVLLTLYCATIAWILMP